MSASQRGLGRNCVCTGWRAIAAPLQHHSTRDLCEVWRAREVARVVLQRLVMKHLPAHASTHRPAPIDIRTLLVKDHACLEELFAELDEAFRTSDRDRCAALWNYFDSTLEAHLALEERLILPELAKVDAVEAAALIGEHAAIRTSLGELGIGVDLHCTNAEAVESFLRLLEAHAKREDALMYRWANANLKPGTQSTLREQLGAAFRKLAARQF